MKVVQVSRICIPERMSDDESPCAPGTPLHPSMCSGVFCPPHLDFSKNSLAPQVEYGEDDDTPRERHQVAVSGIQQLEEVLAQIGKDDLEALKRIRQSVDARVAELQAEVELQRKLSAASEVSEESLPNVSFVDDGNKMVRPSSKISDWDIGREVGQGRYGKVFSAKNRSNGSAEAVKVITKKDLVGVDDWLNLRGEHQSLAQLGKHPNIAGMTGALQSDERIYFFMTLAKGKELFDFIKLRQQNKKPVPKEATAQLLWSMSKALAHCHEKDICHRDMKPENILINQDYTATLVDFGCACSRFELKNQCVGSMPFIAPEFLLGTATDGAPGDIWSLGVVLLEMLHMLSALSRALGWETTEMSTQECGNQLMTRFADPVEGLSFVRSALGVQYQQSPVSSMSFQAQSFKVTEEAQFEGDEQLATMLHADPAKRPLAQNLREAAWLKQFPCK